MSLWDTIKNGWNDLGEQFNSVPKFQVPPMNIGAAFNSVEQKLQPMVTNTAKNLGQFLLNTSQNVSRPVSNYFGNDATYGGIAKNTIKGLPSAALDVFTGKENVFRTMNNPSNNILKGIYNLGAGVGNSVITEGILKPENDVVRNVANFIQKGQVLPYNQLNSGPARIGYDLMGQGGKNFQNVAGDVAQTALPILNAWGGGKGKELVAQGMKQLGLKELAIQGAKTGFKGGGIFGILQGLQDNRDQSLGQDLLNTGVSGLFGAGAGAGLGFASPYVGDQLSKMGVDLMNKFKPTKVIKANINGTLITLPELEDKLNIANKEKFLNTYSPAEVKSWAQNLFNKAEKKIVNVYQEPQSFLGKVGEIGAGLSIKDVSGETSNAVSEAYPNIQQALENGIKNAKENPNRGFPILGDKTPTAKRTTIGDFFSKNPIKINISEVNPGDYAKARSNAQLASSPIKTIAGQVINSVKGLSEKDKNLFRYAIEDPSLIQTAENPKAMQEAIRRAKILTDTVHATGQSLGGDTGYLENYWHRKWDLSNPEDAARFQEMAKSKFGGLYNQDRVFNSIKEGEAAGFKLANPDPLKDIQDYANTSSYILHQEALAKGIQEADRGQQMAHVYDMGGGRTIDVSKQGKHELQVYNNEMSKNPLLRGYRSTNRTAKRTLLSWSQFHPININSLQAAPTSVLRGHPIRAVRGLFDSTASMLPVYADKVLQGAVERGTIEDAARIGTPIKFGSDFSTGGELSGKSVSGEKMIFERQMPAMHIQMVEGLVSDLNKKGISLDGPEARAAGDAINRVMGFINTETKNLNPNIQRGLGDVLLAPQFTRSKWSLLKDAFTKGGQAGDIARKAVIGKYGAEAIMAVTLGAIFKEKSDNIKDILLRTLIKPSIPTPMKDSKGNNIQLNMPQNYLSEALGLGLSLERGSDGHLHVKFEPNKIKENIANYGRNRLAIIPNAGLKIATNTNFANKPLYDNTADLGTEATQALTTLFSGQLPIGLQGALYTPGIINNLPQASQDILNANKPGDHPFLKSIGSSFGLTPVTDKTVGKGLSTDQYFSSIDDVAKGLNPNDKQAFLGILHPTTKNIDGSSMVDKNLYTTPEKYTVLLQNPKILEAEKQMQLSQPSHDPLWDLKPQQLKAYLQAQVISKTNPGGDKKTVNALYGIIPQKFFTDRQNYFNGLVQQGIMQQQTGGKPQANPQMQHKLDFYNTLPSGTGARSAFLRQNPDVLQFFQQGSDYTNAQRADMGLPLLQSFSSSGGKYGPKKPKMPKFKMDSKVSTKGIRTDLTLGKLFKQKKTKQPFSLQK